MLELFSNYFIKILILIYELCNRSAGRAVSCAKAVGKGFGIPTEIKQKHQNHVIHMFIRHHGQGWQSRGSISGTIPSR